MNNLSETAVKTFKHDGDKCDSCKTFFFELSPIFTNTVGFKDLCFKCVIKNDFEHNKNINKFPSKIEFDKRRVI